MERLVTRMDDKTFECFLFLGSGFLALVSRF